MAVPMGVTDLVDLLTVEAAGHDRFIGHSPPDRDRQVYGGQFLAQALQAAAATVEGDRLPHSLHAYFLRTGEAKAPITYQVERIRDGRTASHRSVVASQGDREVFRQLMSFQTERPGLSHSAASTSVPPPATDPSSFVDYRDWVADLSDNDHHPWFAEELPVEIRIENPPPTTPRVPMHDDLAIWMRLSGPAPAGGPSLQPALLAWMSDKTISDVVLYPHGRSWTDADSDILSLDHAMWFHRPIEADRWHRLNHQAVSTSRGRGLARGDYVTLEGDVVASVAQEAHILLPDDVVPDRAVAADSTAG